jgi:hypothetical protein
VPALASYPHVRRPGQDLAFSRAPFLCVGLSPFRFLSRINNSNLFRVNELFASVVRPATSHMSLERGTLTVSSQRSSWAAI